ERNTAFQTAIIKATAPLVKKIEQLEKVNTSLEAKLIALKDATSSQTNKINKINSVSEHIKKKLTTNTPANTANDTSLATSNPPNNTTRSYATAAASNTHRKQHTPPKGPNTTTTTSTANNDSLAKTTASQTNAATPATIQQRRFFITRNTNTPLNIAQHKIIKDTINNCLREVAPTDHSLTVVAVRDTLRHNVELLSREDCTAERILKHEKTIL